MTADEALALVETVLDGKRLNDVQELRNENLITSAMYNK
jgi:hypothetical protein